MEAFVCSFFLVCPIADSRQRQLSVFKCQKFFANSLINVWNDNGVTNIYNIHIYIGENDDGDNDYNDANNNDINNTNDNDERIKER